MIQGIMLTPERLFSRFINWQGIMFPEMTLTDVREMLDICILFIDGKINKYSTVTFRGNKWIVDHLFDEYKIPVCEDKISIEFCNN